VVIRGIEEIDSAFGAKVVAVKDGDGADYNADEDKGRAPADHHTESLTIPELLDAIKCVTRNTLRPTIVAVARVFT